MRLLSTLALFFVSFSMAAADFQLPDYVLGTEKSALKAELLAKTNVTLFEAEAKLHTEWQEDKLTALVLNFYQGTEYQALRQSTQQLLAQLTSQFGAIAWVSSEADPAATQTLEQQLGLLDQVMKAAPELATGYKQSHLAHTNLALDFQPKPQPDNVRLHVQISFLSMSGEYSLMLFVDNNTAVERTATAIVNLEAF